MNDLIQGVAFHGRQLASLAALALSAWVFGEALLARLGLDDERDRGAVAAALGLGLIAQGIFILGIAGGLRPLPIVIALVAGHALCRRTWQR